MQLPSPRDNRYLFLDMNAFFAACEQHRNPELRGKAIAVSPTKGDSGAIIAASYEAKKHGITTGWRVGDAKQRIPNLIVVPTSHTYYADIHHQLVRFLETEISPTIEVMSVDEMAIPLTPFEQQTLEAHRLALQIKAGINERFSAALQCSIGIGPNRFLAKLGTEIQKPNGLVIIQLHTLAEAYTTLKLRDIPGINFGMERRLHTLGIRSPLEFFAAPRDLLHNALGISGDAWWFNLHGYEVNRQERPTQSLSHSHVLAPALRHKPQARAVLYKLWIKVTDRLRDKQLTTTHIYARVRTKTSAWEKIVHLHPTQNTFEVFEQVAKAYDQEIPEHAQPYKVYVVASQLQPKPSVTQTLWTTNDTAVENLFSSVEKINHRHGRWTVQPASLLPIRDSAPNRITFRKPDYQMD